MNREAAVTAEVDAADELEAFAERFEHEPFEIDDADLVLLRDRFDLLTDRRAEPLGPEVGKALLLDGFVYRNGKRVEVKVSPAEAYLCRTLDSDYAYWPDAAGDLPGIHWLSAAYDVKLKTGATRAARKRSDGTISRGPRKFLMLLGGACAPRVTKVKGKAWGGPLRNRELRALGAEFVEEDYVSTDLERVLNSLSRDSKKDRRLRSAALMKALSRYWDGYTDKLKVESWHRAVKYVYPKGGVTADWLCHLHETPWVAVGGGDLAPPSQAVIKNSQTQTLYGAENFAVGLSLDEVRPALAATLRLITDARASDLVALLEQVASEAEVDTARTQQVYRSLAKLCPSNLGWNTKIGDVPLTELRQRFAAGAGLIWVPSRDGRTGRWRRPAELFTGRDIFLDSERFVPGGPSCHDLWSALQIRKPGLDACIDTLRGIAAEPYGSRSEGVLIEVYRHLEGLLGNAERRQKERLRTLPVGVAGAWVTTRPVYHLQDRELRTALAEARPDLRFWAPPCDTHSLPNVCAALGLTRLEPAIEVTANAGAIEAGESMRSQFRRCVDHLSNELARNDPAARDRLSIPWQDFQRLALFVYRAPFEVRVRAPELSREPVAVRMRAVLETEPARLHVDESALAQREHCGRAIATLFAEDARHRIEAEWVASWVASIDMPVSMMPTASDEELARALADRAAVTTAAPPTKIKVTAPKSSAAKDVPPRRLKAALGGVTSVTVVAGNPPKGPAGPRPPLASSAPSPSTPSPPASAPTEYDNADLEQRGWEILCQVLNATSEPQIADFRRRHRVGADGAIDWKTFVEMKATGRGPQTSVEMSATEFERAKERGLDFMLALVSGLEEGHLTEVRLILDPANRAANRPIGAIRLVGLMEAPSVLIQISDEAPELISGTGGEGVLLGA